MELRDGTAMFIILGATGWISKKMKNGENIQILMISWFLEEPRVLSLPQSLKLVPSVSANEP